MASKPPITEFSQKLHQTEAPKLSPEQQKELDRSVPLYNKRPISFVRGSGALLYDSDGNEYIDCGANYGTTNVGHCNPSVVEAIKTQAEQLLYLSSTYYNRQRGDLMEKLVDITAEPLSKVFLCNSGTEAVEAALKFARVSTKRKEIIAMTRAFHGRTYGALSATHSPKYREPFMPLVPSFKHVPYGNIDALGEGMNEDTAAVILEPVLGEGGVVLPPENYLQEVRKLCDSNGAILILDEIQTGFGRTGRMFAYEYAGVVPDILCLAKSIAGGLPMGAVVGTEGACNVPKQSHGSTFGGNPLVCAAANAAIRYIVDNDLPARAGEVGDHFLERLRGLDSSQVREVRGLGLMIAIEFKRKAGPYIQGLLKKRVLALPSGSNIIRFLPPLVIEKAQVDIVVDKLEQVILNE